MKGDEALAARATPSSNNASTVIGSRLTHKASTGDHVSVVGS